MLGVCFGYFTCNFINKLLLLLFQSGSKLKALEFLYNNSFIVFGNYYILAIILLKLKSKLSNRVHDSQLVVRYLALTSNYNAFGN